MVAPAERREVGLGSDHELVAAVRQGDDRAFESLYGRYHRRIAAYVYGMVNDYGRAEDITQDVFISALRRMRETERPITFKPWIYEIAKNACIDQFRRARRAEEVSFDADDGVGALEHARLTAVGGGPDLAVDAKQQLDHLCGAFGGLSQTHHRILVMRELEGLSYREIGERMGLSRPSVESTLFRARRRLTEEYDELVSGQRCARIRTIIVTSPGRALGARDERRLVRHIAHCQPCRREARLAGFQTAVGRPLRTPVAARVAAFLPLPWLVRTRRADAADAEQASPGLLAQVSGPLSSAADPIASWTKAAAAAAVVLVAGAGAVSELSFADKGADPVRTTHAVAEPTRRDAAERAPRPTSVRRAAVVAAPRSPGRAAPGRDATSPPAPSQRSTGTAGDAPAPVATGVPVAAPSLPAPPPELPTAPGADQAPAAPDVAPVVVSAGPGAAARGAADAMGSAHPRAGELGDAVADALGG